MSLYGLPEDVNCRTARMMVGIYTATFVFGFLAMSASALGRLADTADTGGVTWWEAAARASASQALLERHNPLSAATILAVRALVAAKLLVWGGPVPRARAPTPPSAGLTTPAAPSASPSPSPHNINISTAAARNDVSEAAAVGVDGFIGTTL